MFFILKFTYVFNYIYYYIYRMFHDLTNKLREHIPQVRIRKKRYMKFDWKCFVIDLQTNIYLLNSETPCI